MTRQKNDQGPDEVALRPPLERSRSGKREAEPPSSATRAGLGSLAGAVATIPMTVVMGAIHSRITDGFWRPPPPYEVTVEMADELGIDKELTLPDRLLLTMLSHFGYGAAAGAAYSLTAAHAPLPPPLKGIAFGSLVWAGSYLGWLPAAGFQAAAPNQSRQRNMMMLAAHVAWGWSLGALYAKWVSRATLPPERERDSVPRILAGASRGTPA